MAQVGIAKELPDSPSGGRTIGKDASSEYERRFLVEFDTIQAAVVTAEYATGIPADWSTYAFGTETDLLARLYNKTATRRGGNPDCSSFWEVVCKYKSFDEEDEDPDDPTQEPPKIDGDFVITNELCHMQYLSSSSEPDEGIRASNGELFKIQPTREVDNMVLRITRNEAIATNVPNNARKYNNKINDAAVTIAGVVFPVHSVKVRIRFSREHKEIGSGATKTQIRFWKVSYEIAHREATWDLKLLDHGSYYEDPAIGKVNFETETGDRYLGLLNNFGDQSATPMFLNPPLRVFDTAAFSTLSLPTVYT